MVKVGEAVGLHALIFRAAQLCAEAVRSAGRIAGVQEAGDESQNSAACHQKPLAKEKRQIAVRNAHVDNIRHQERDQHFKDAFHKDEDDGRDEIAAVAAYITQLTGQAPS